jgi:hypothetical protein
MEKQESISQDVLRNLALFRARQRTTPVSHDENLRKRQYQELQEILSPFWAWRMKSSG